MSLIDKIRTGFGLIQAEMPDSSAADSGFLIANCACYGLNTGFGMGYNRDMKQDPRSLISRLADLALKQQVKLCTAESCTGGLIAKSFTDLAGSSDWFERGFVTYSNAAKNESIGVPESVIREYGAVSEPVANAMAGGALRNSAAQLALAVTGVAGPAGGSEDKPVGTVWIAVASEKQAIAKSFLFPGDREAIREASLVAAIELLLNLMEADQS